MKAAVFFSPACLLCSRRAAPFRAGSRSVACVAAVVATRSESVSGRAAALQNALDHFIQILHPLVVPHLVVKIGGVHSFALNVGNSFTQPRRLARALEHRSAIRRPDGYSQARVYSPGVSVLSFLLAL